MMSFWVTLSLAILSTPAFCNINNDMLKLLATTPPKQYTAVSPVTLSQAPKVDIEGIGCGWRHETGLGDRMTGVTDAYFGEFPWVVAIFKYSEVKNSYEYCCVGSLIHPKVVLSVKHYFKKPARIRIRAGDWDIAKEFEIHFHQSSDVTKVLSHPEYKSSTNAFDAALLVLSTPINVAANVAFACLPLPDLVIPPGTRCFVAGWGQESYKNETIRPIMKMVDLPVVDFRVCEDQIRKVVKRKVQSFDLSPSMMCAGGEEGVDACLKDGGAPLVCPYSEQSNRYYQAGIVSWGIGCGLKDVPGVYTSVPKIRGWVDDAMKSMGYDSVTYSP